MPLHLSMSQAIAALAKVARGGRVFVPGGPVEPVALRLAFAQEPENAADLIFCGMMIPNVNSGDWASLHEDARAELFLPAPNLAPTIASGQTLILPLHYRAAYRYLCEAPFKAAVFHVRPPDSQGLCNLSLSADSSEAFLNRDVFKLAIINPSLPHLHGAPSIAYTAFDAVVASDAPPITLAPDKKGPENRAIAERVAALVDDGATIQAGIGKLPSSVVAALAKHRDLKIHSGLIGDWALDLLDGGAISDAHDAMTAGVILGSKALHERLRDEGRLKLKPIDFTHDQAVLSALPQFTSLNAALEIDLFGQINCEYAGTRTIAGVGGALDFLRGARASAGGKPIVMIAAEGKNGASRVVPRLTTPTISIARSDAPIVVTEYGAIDLEPLDTNARAQAIMGLASPQHRPALLSAWQDISS
jgi:acyl-CoA hydrolase